jgi:hypothetical protein
MAGQHAKLHPEAQGHSGLKGKEKGLVWTFFNT